MATVHPTPVVPPVHRFWVTATAAVAVIVVGGLAIVGGAGLLNRSAAPLPAAVSPSPASQSPASQSPALPSNAPTTEPTVRPALPPSGDPVHVTGTFDTSAGSMCAPPWCQFDGTVRASDSRLSGTYIIESGHATVEASVGTLAIYEPGTGAGWRTISSMSTDKLIWEGVWFTTGSRLTGLESTGGQDVDSTKLWPLDQVWLEGRNRNAGQTAVLRIAADGNLEAWIFTTPTSH